MRAALDNGQPRASANEMTAHDRMIDAARSATKDIGPGSRQSQVAGEEDGSFNDVPSPRSPVCRARRFSCRRFPDADPHCVRTPGEAV